MVNQQLVDWIKAAEAKGYSPEQIRDYLTQKGYSSNEIDETIGSTSATNMPKSQQTTSTQQVFPDTTNMPYGQQPPSNLQTSGSTGIKRRNPFLVLLFAVITFGIYQIYWLYSTTKELKGNTQSAPKLWLLWLLLIPIVNIVVMIIYLWKYCKAINELTGFSNVLLFILWFVFSPVAIILTQIELNKKAA